MAYKFLSIHNYQLVEISGSTERQMHGQQVKQEELERRSRKVENTHVKTDLVFNLPITFIITFQQIFLKR